MWAKGRFSHMPEFVTKVKKFGFYPLERKFFSPQGLNESIETSFPISSIHRPPTQGGCRLGNDCQILAFQSNKALRDCQVEQERRIISPRGINLLQKKVIL